MCSWAAGAFRFAPAWLCQARRDYLDEIAEAIIFALTGIWRRIGATTGRMGNAMFSEALRFRVRMSRLMAPALRAMPPCSPSRNIRRRRGRECSTGSR